MTKHKLTSPRIAEKLGFSLSLSPDTISAYHDAAKYEYPEGKAGKRIRRAFMRGWNNGYITLGCVKRDIAAGVIFYLPGDPSMETYYAAKTAFKSNTGL